MSATEQGVHAKTAQDVRLDEVTIKQLTWKPGTAVQVAVEIVKQALDGPDLLWPDQVELGWVPAADRNCIGTAWRNLAKQGVLEHGTSFRKSEKESSGGRTIFSYQLKSRALAERFLRVNGAQARRMLQTALL